MDQSITCTQVLHLLRQPAFLADRERITALNQAAQSLLLVPGMPIAPLLGEAAGDYGEFSQGELHIQLTVQGLPTAATVTMLGDQMLFRLCPSSDPELQTLAMAASVFGQTLADVTCAASSLSQLESAPQEDVRCLNRGLHRLRRMLSNMNDAAAYAVADPRRREWVDVAALFQEIFDKAQVYAQAMEVTLEYTGLRDSIPCGADIEKLERGTLNLLSNAILYGGKGCTIRARLTRSGDRLALRIQDNGPGIPREMIPTVHQRYLRTPGLEAPPVGLGLGLTLAREAACAHGGTVLLQQDPGKGATVVMTMSAACQVPEDAFQSPSFRFDYASGKDHTLLEFSDFLPYKFY